MINALQTRSESVQVEDDEVSDNRYYRDYDRENMNSAKIFRGYSQKRLEISSANSKHVHVDGVEKHTVQKDKGR